MKMKVLKNTLSSAIYIGSDQDFREAMLKMLKKLKETIE